MFAVDESKIKCQLNKKRYGQYYVPFSSHVSDLFFFVVVEIYTPIPQFFMVAYLMLQAVSLLI